MTEPQKDNDETKFNETLKRMLNTPPKPHRPADKDASDQQEKEKPAK